MTTTQAPSGIDLQQRLRAFIFALDHFGDAFFAESDPSYLDGMKDAVEFLSTGHTPKRFARS